MGLVGNNDLYQCGVAWVAVTDFGLLYSIYWSDTSEEVSGPLPGSGGEIGDALAETGTHAASKKAPLAGPFF